MATSNFVDYVRIFCRSGDGGSGSVHFRREKYIPFGGPDGGDGGKGGDIIMVGNAQMWTLLHLRYTRHLRAEHGGNGAKQQRTGSSAPDILIQVPLGTIARNNETGEMMGEIITEGQQIVLLHGGRGGQGNEHFKTAINQAPKFAQPGDEGLEASIVFELKILADVGLVGFPNAGKSTLLSVLSAARPEIADYPFTTLVPNLGMVAYRNQQSFVMADIPGIIEGAHEGKGLGLRFLRHIERNSILLFMVPADADDITEQYQILLNELRQYNPELLDKQRILAISKSDMLDEDLINEIAPSLPATIPHIFISSITNYKIMELKDLIWRSLNMPENLPGKG
ncbi:MAG: GTPase ObgE [Bacteroidetes bacterium GWF2_41_31]|nr:MAG: GTPase ObgE [Bacteroidetes bacterium GWF2_41_31]